MFHCCQVATSGGLQYSTTLPSNGVITSQTVDTAALQAGQTLLTDCSQHAAAAGQPITNFGHQLLLQPQFAFGPGNGLPVLDAAGNVAGDLATNPAAYGLQLPAGTDLSHLQFPPAAQPGLPGDPTLLQHDKKKATKKKAGTAGTITAGGTPAAGALGQLPVLDTAGYPYIPGNGFPASAGVAAAPSQAVVDLDSETDSNHDTALTLACAGGHEELVNLLLSRGADIEHRDKKGFTPLILAATAGHDKVRLRIFHSKHILNIFTSLTWKLFHCMRGCNDHIWSTPSIRLGIILLNQHQINLNSIMCRWWRS